MRAAIRTNDRVAVVVPTLGRPSLRALLASLSSARGPRPAEIVLVDDRCVVAPSIALDGCDDDLRGRIRIVPGACRGPAAARNRGWRSLSREWIAFLDDDVVVGPDWFAALERDITAADAEVAATQGRVTVPLPSDRPATDWERNVAGLTGAQWITADCAYRRADLAAVGGFDERFPRAYREDADLALRVVARGRRIVLGERESLHPVRPAPWWISLRLQRGNADDVLMDALHGRDWRERAGSPRGAFGAHARTVGVAAVAALALVTGRRRTSAVAAAAWLTATVAFAGRRIAPGPRTHDEIVAMLLTSAVIPFAAVGHRLRGRLALRGLLADPRAPRPLPAAVLFDRDGTLVVDVPYNGDPARVEPMPGAARALARLRAAGVPTAIVSNQSGIADGRLSPADVDAVNARLAALIGPLGPVMICPHGSSDGCACRKPAPGLIVAAAAVLGVAPHECVVVGDIGADVDAARNAGARAILVPTAVTRAEEIAAAAHVAHSLDEAVDALLGGRA